MKISIKSIVSIFISMAFVINGLSPFNINAQAKDKTLKLNYIVTNSFIAKNGMPDGFQNKMKSSYNKAKLVYSVAFGINIEMNKFIMGNKTIISTNAEKCPNYSVSNYDNACNCTSGNNCGKNPKLHHSNANYIIKENLAPIYDFFQINVLLTANDLCHHADHNPSYLTHSYIYGIADTNENAIIVTDTKIKDGPYIYDNLDSTTVHEIGHLYKTIDHQNNSSYDQNCIWGANRHQYKIARSCKMCTKCVNTIKSNKNRYNQ